MKPNQDVIQFFTDKKVLIVDFSGACRSLVKEVLRGFNVDDRLVKSTNRFNDAIKYIQTEQPEVVFTDMSIGDRSGLELVTMMKSYIKNRKESLFYIITSDTNESSVAEAAEEDVDNYLLKPFSFEDLTKYLESTVNSKVKPSLFQKALDEAKEAIKANEHDKAIAILVEAKKLSKKPTLACYYSGESQRSLESLDHALKEFDEGLGYNNIHYRCLVGRFEVLDEQRKTKEAYETVKEVVKHFPVSPQRLGRILRLAVYTQHFEDAEKYYELFTRLERPSEDLRKVVTAALMVCGKFLVKKGDPKRALVPFKNAIKTSKLDVDLIDSLLQYLLDELLVDEADDILSLYPVQQRSRLNFYKFQLIILYKQGKDEQALDYGKKLVKEGKATVEVFESVSMLLVDMGMFRAGENMLYQGIEAFPNSREKFSLLLDDIEGRKAGKT